MLIKSADDRSQDIAELKALLADLGLTTVQKKLIQEELDNLEKGAWGEERAAYFIDFHFAGGKNNIVLHDLRLVLLDGRTAQIDHLIVNRMMFFFVLESKNWKQLTVDEDGICTTWHGRIVGVESPLEQCKRQAKVLEAAFIDYPQLYALAPRREFISKVLVAPSCNLKAPHHKDCYVKADHFHNTWDKEFDDASLMRAVIGLSRRVSLETLVNLGHALAALHQPKRINWRAKFGLSELTTDCNPPPNKLVASIAGLSDYVPKWGEDWFVLQGKPTEETKKTIRAAGYRATKENGEWVWRLNKRSASSVS